MPEAEWIYNKLRTLGFL